MVSPPLATTQSLPDGNHTGAPRTSAALPGTASSDYAEHPPDFIGNGVVPARRDDERALRVGFDAPQLARDVPQPFGHGDYPAVCDADVLARIWGIRVRERLLV